MARTVAIVGRPNVGKSALFNRLAGRKISIVHDQPGVTRDRLDALCTLGQAPFTIVDTGGIGSDVDTSFTEQVRSEAEIAMATAELILFVVDGQAGLHAVDQDLAKLLRRIQKPVLLVINKIDHDKHTDFAGEFERLGFERSLSISAEHNRGIEGLVEQIESLLPPPQAEGASKESKPVSIALVGRPNVGKSSLINGILNDQRTLVSNISGTTRDAIDIPYTRDGIPYILIDTAGIRPKGKRDSSVEVFSVMRSERSIRRADLCILVIDAQDGVTAQDKKVAGLIQEAQKPCVVAVNKWDLLKSEREIKEFMESIRVELFFVDYAPVVVLSAKTGDNLERLFRCIDLVRQDSKQKISTGQLNRLLQNLLSANPPPARKNKRFKILYATQLEKAGSESIPVPKLLFFVNDTEMLPGAYKKYMDTQLRKTARFMGLPIILEMRGRTERAGKGD